MAKKSFQLDLFSNPLQEVRDLTAIRGAIKPAGGIIYSEADTGRLSENSSLKK
jgi:hypothetical protein